MNRLISRLVLASLLFFGAAILVPAQQAQQGRISGRVTDPKDDVIYQADVQIMNLDTHMPTPEKTDTMGSFWVTPLPAGHYQITIEAPGFSSYKSANITLAKGPKRTA
jgi:Carboxypeptidase regulatory-like domain